MALGDPSVTRNGDIWFNWSEGLIKAQVAGVIGTVVTSLPLSFGETNATPTEARSFLVRVWANGTVDNDAGQTNPSRIDGANNAVRAAIKTNNSVGDLTNPVTATTSTYDQAPTVGTFTSKTLRIWFNIPARGTALDTLTIVRNTVATGDVTIFTHAGTAALNHDNGTFTNDVSAITLADLQTLTVTFSYTAAVVAAPETVMNVDACAVDMVSTFA